MWDRLVGARGPTESRSPGVACDTAAADTAAAMSEENVNLARCGYEAFNRGDREAWLAIIHPDAELFLPFFQQLERGGPAHGRTGAAELWESWHAAFADASFEPDTIRDLGDTTFVALRVRGRGASSDVPIEQQSWHVIEWQDGQVIRLRAFWRRPRPTARPGFRSDQRSAASVCAIPRSSSRAARQPSSVAARLTSSTTL